MQKRVQKTKKTKGLNKRTLPIQKRLILQRDQAEKIAFD